MDKYEQLTKDLMMAKDYALSQDTNEDGGTCNLDTCVLVLKGWNYKKLQVVADEAKVFISKWTSGEYHVYGYANGQANRRTRMVQAFTKVLQEKGYETYIYYCID